MSTRVATEPFFTRREIFEYLLDHPDFATHVTRALKLARYRSGRRPKACSWTTAGAPPAGSRWSTPSRPPRLLCARRPTSTLVPTINGEAVATIEYDVTPAGEHRDLVTATVSGFVEARQRPAGVRDEDGGTGRPAQGRPRGPTSHADVRAREPRHRGQPGRRVRAVSQRPDVPLRELQEFGRLLNLR